MPPDHQVVCWDETNRGVCFYNYICEAYNAKKWASSLMHRFSMCWKTKKGRFEHDSEI